MKERNRGRSPGGINLVSLQVTLPAAETNSPVFWLQLGSGLNFAIKIFHSVSANKLPRSGRKQAMSGKTCFCFGIVRDGTTILKLID